MTTIIHRDTGGVQTTFGWLFTLAGAALIVWGLIYDPSVEVNMPGQDYGYGITGPATTDRIINVGQATMKLMIFTAGGFAALQGTVLIGIGAILKSVAQTQPWIRTAPATQAAAAAGGAETSSTTAAGPQTASSDNSMWGWIAIGGVAVVAVLIFLYLFAGTGGPIDPSDPTEAARLDAMLDATEAANQADAASQAAEAASRDAAKASQEATDAQRASRP